MFFLAKDCFGNVLYDVVSEWSTDMDADGNDMYLNSSRYPRPGMGCVDLEEICLDLLRKKWIHLQI